MALTKIPSSLLDTSGGFDLQGNITLGDNEQILLGDSSDLAIYHSGAHSFITDSGTGDLIIQGSNAIRLRSSTGENMAIFNADGAATLQYDNLTKITTSSTGATVTGTLTVTGDLDITGDINSYNVTDLDVTDQTITLGAGQTEANSGGSGIIIDGSNASILWDETNDQFDINKGLNVTGEAEFANKLKVYSENNAVVAIDSLSNAYMVIDRSADDRRGALVFSTAAADVFSSPPATGTINWALGVSDSDELSGNKFAIKAGDTNFSNAQFVIDSAGNVGIGTDSPGFPLHVNSSSTDVAKFQTSGAYTYTRFQNSSKTWALSVGSSFSFYDEAASATRMLIDSSGTIGIATTPKSTNTFHADMFVGPSLYIANYNSGANQQSIFGNNTYYNSGYKAVTGDTAASMVNFSQGNVTFDTATTVSADAAQSFTTKFYIKNDGNVGIGTDTPAKKLEIFGSGSENGILVKNDTNTNYRGYYISSVESDNTAYGKFHMDVNSGELNITSGYSGWGGYITFNTNGSQRMSITSSDITLKPGNGTVIVDGGTADYEPAKVELQGRAFGGDITAKYEVSDGGAVFFGSTTNHSVRFIANNTEKLRIESSQILLNAGSQTYSNNQRLQSASESITWSSSTSAQSWTSSNYLPYQKFVEAALHFGYSGNSAISQHFYISLLNNFTGLSIQTIQSSSGNGGSSYHTISFTSTGAYNTRRLVVQNTPAGGQNTANLNGTIYYGFAR